MCVRRGIRKNLWIKKNTLPFLISIRHTEKHWDISAVIPVGVMIKSKMPDLPPVFDGETTYFAEADLVFVCKKLYSGTLTESGFTDKALVDFNYPERDFHTMYVGEVVKILENEHTT